MPWDNLIRLANKAEARVKIQRSTHLDQWYIKVKQPLKMSLNSCDDQAKKTKATPVQTKASPPMFNQSKITKKANEKAKKEKTRRRHLGKQDR